MCFPVSAAPGLFNVGFHVLWTALKALARYTCFGHKELSSGYFAR
jgi:hypothetical protein